MKQILMILLSLLTVSLQAQTDFFNRLEKERVASTGSIQWEQVGPGNAGFANLLRYHPTIPKLVVLCPDMWNIYKSKDNGSRWSSMKDFDGNGDFFHIRDLYFSPNNTEFGVAIESSRLWKTEDTGETWTYMPNCPWYKKDADGFDQDGWRKKVAALAIDPNDKDVWFVGGGSNVRGQEWLSCYKNVTAATPRGDETDSQGKVGKLWRTINGGDSWELVNNGLDPKVQVGRIIVNPKNSKQVFAASNYGVYRSDDAGTNWSQISSGKLDNDIIMNMDFYYDKVKGTFVLYVIDQVQYLPNGKTTKCTGGIFKSEDNGDTWVNITGDLGLDIGQLTGGVPSNYYKFIANWMGISESLAKSTYPELPKKAIQFFNMLSVDPSRAGALYIGFADPQVANSIMPGRLWTTSNDGEKWINTARLYEDAWAKDKAYWTSRGNPYHENMKVGHESPHMRFGSDYALRSMRGIDVGVDGSVMIISDHSTMLSTDHGATWDQMDEYYTSKGNIVGRGNSNLPGLTIGQDKRYKMPVLGSGEHRVWLVTDDSPDEYQALKFVDNAQETVISLAFDPYDDQTIYSTSSRQANKQYIFASKDGGYNWEEHGVATPATNKWLDDFYTNALTVDPINNEYLYFGITKIVDKTKGDMGGFYVSNDHGKTFKQSNNGLPSPARISDILIDPRDETRASLFAAAQKSAFSQELPLAQGGLYHSTDRGQNWVKVKTPSSVVSVMEMTIDHTNRLYITTGYRGNGDGLWYTDDFGVTWHQVFKYAGTRSVDVSPFDHNLLVVTVEYLAKNPGVFVSHDRGKTWAKSNFGFGTPHKIEDIEFNIHLPNELWIANLGCGFYKGRIQSDEAIQIVDIKEDAIEFSSALPTVLTANIIDNTFAGNTISWKSENPSIATVDETGRITPISKGTTKVWATTSTGRFSDYASVIVHSVEKVVSGIANKSDSMIQIYPNPSQGIFAIKGLKEKADIKIFNNVGREVYSIEEIEKVNISHLDSGVYHLQINYEDKILVKKILLKK